MNVVISSRVALILSLSFETLVSHIKTFLYIREYTYDHRKMNMFCLDEYVATNVSTLWRIFGLENEFGNDLSLQLVAGTSGFVRLSLS